MSDFWQTATIMVVFWLAGYATGRIKARMESK